MKTSRQVRFQLKIQKIIYIILLLSIAGLLAWLTANNNVQYDWTANKRNTLSQASIDLLHSLKEPVIVSAYVEDDPTTITAVEEILDRYKRVKPDFNYQIYNPDTDIEQAQLDNITQYGQFVVKYNNLKQNLTSLNEQTFSNALQRMSRAGGRKVIFLQGHGERNPANDRNTDYSKLSIELSQKGIIVSTHNLLESGLPDDISVLVIAAPDKAFVEGEVEHIKNHIDAGGNLLWMMDPGSMQGLDTIAELLGIHFLDGIIVDDNSNLRETLRIKHPAMIPVLSYLPHAITANLSYNTIFPISRGILQTDKSNWRSTAIAQSLPRSWSEAAGLSEEIVFDSEAGDVAGPVTIALALEKPAANSETGNKQHNQRIVIIGDSDFLANSYIGAGANLLLGLNIINWLADDDELILVEPRNAPDTQLELNDTEILLIGFGFFILLPACLIIAGMFIWFVRRKR